MGGTDFLTLFKTYYRLGKFEEMLRFTSKSSIEKYGKDKILEAYKKMEFGYDIKLLNKNDQSDGTIKLNYETSKVATKGVLRITVNIEGDTVRLVTGNISQGDVFGEK
jgi:hypothetical protein